MNVDYSDYEDEDDVCDNYPECKNIAQPGMPYCSECNGDD